MQQWHIKNHLEKEEGIQLHFDSKMSAQRYKLHVKIQAEQRILDDAHYQRRVNKFKVKVKREDLILLMQLAHEGLAMRIEEAKLKELLTR